MNIRTATANIAMFGQDFVYSYRYHFVDLSNLHFVTRTKCSQCTGWLYTDPSDNITKYLGFTRWYKSCRGTRNEDEITPWEFHDCIHESIPQLRGYVHTSSLRRLWHHPAAIYHDTKFLVQNHFHKSQKSKLYTPK